MNKIRFSHVWDKLRDPEFTTIRTWTKEKEDYYHSKVNSHFQVWKSKETYPFRLEYVICRAWLFGAFGMSPADISIATLEKDTTLNGQVQTDWVERFQKQDRVLVLFFSKSKPSQSKLEDIEVMK
jgi:hypothetical protein